MTQNNVILKIKFKLGNKTMEKNNNWKTMKASQEKRDSRLSEDHCERRGSKNLKKKPDRQTIFFACFVF